MTADAAAGLAQFEALRPRLFGIAYRMLGSAIDAETPVIALLWNNRGYGEIKTYMQGRGIEPVGVDLHTPDFVAIARAYGWTAERLESAPQLPELLRQAARRSGPTLIVMDEAVVMG